MAVRTILTVPHDDLRAECAPVEEFGTVLSELIQDMFDTMYAAPGRGLAAPQIGVRQRIFVMDATWKDGERTPIVFVNPELVESSDEHSELEEGCLSIPNQTSLVSRPSRVLFAWQDLEGVGQSQWFEGFSAACVQHERDHLDGVLCTDYEERS